MKEDASSGISSRRADKLKKKELYKQQVIQDSTGIYDYDKDPVEYKKARKRMQNWESALKQRFYKMYQIGALSTELSTAKTQVEELQKKNEVLEAEKA